MHIDDMTTQEYIAAHKSDDVRRLALASHPAGVDMQYALTQISGWQVARSKVPLWAATDGIIYPRHLSLEQCTSQYVAQFKADFVKNLLGTGFSMADLTGGMGVDCFFISQNAGRTVYNEIQPALCELARHNFAALGRPDIEVSNGDSPHRTFDLIYLDPARRDDAGRKLVSISDCQPDAVAMQEGLKRQARYVMVKLSPMLDISRALSEMDNVRQILIISLDGECKEMTLLIDRDYSDETVISAVDIDRNGKPGMTVSSTHSHDISLPLPIATDIRSGDFIYEPHAALMKSALFRTLAKETSTSLLHPDTHLFHSKDYCPAFPGRSFRLVQAIPFDKRSLAPLIKCQANVSVRNFPLTAAQLQQKLKIRDGGNRYLTGCIMADSKVLLDLERI